MSNKLLSINSKRKVPFTHACTEKHIAQTVPGSQISKAGSPNRI